MGRKSKKEGMYICTQLIHFVVQQKVTTWQSDYMPIKIKKKKKKSWSWAEDSVGGN